MFSIVTPGLPVAELGAGTLDERIARLETVTEQTLSALSAWFQQLNLSGSLRISEATIDGTPIGSTNPDTGAFDSLNVNAGGVITRLLFNAYTPTLTGVANLDTVTAYDTLYAAVHNGVIVAGRFDANPAVNATTTQFGISLPIASALVSQEDAAGVAFANAVAGMGARIYADAANARAMVEWVSSDTADRAWSFIFFYRVK